MDSSFREQGSGTQQNPKRFLASLPILPGIIKWLASLIKLTEEEQEEQVFILVAWEMNKYRSALRRRQYTNRNKRSLVLNRRKQNDPQESGI